MSAFRYRLNLTDPTLDCRFLVCRVKDVNSPPSPAERLQRHFPALSMIIITQCASTTYPNAIRLHVLRPLRSSTVFYVICKTPVYSSVLGRSCPCVPARCIR
jgi:hypothetical protein